MNKPFQKRLLTVFVFLLPFLVITSFTLDIKSVTPSNYSQKQYLKLENNVFENLTKIVEEEEVRTTSSVYSMPSMETIPSGSLVIPMDNTYQSTNSKFNLKAYGLVIRLLHAGIPVKWVIKTGKMKDEVDFTATARRVRPSYSASSSTICSFRAGPIIVYPGFENQALTVINSFGQDVNVYQLNQSVNVDVKYTFSHKPKVGILNNGANEEIHVAICQNAGLTEGTDYITGLTAADIQANSCYTLVTEAHADEDQVNTAEVNNIKGFLRNGGNFLAQCAAGSTYEDTGDATSRLITNNGVDYPGIGGAIIFDNSDDPFAQIHGVLSNEGGTTQSYKTNNFRSGTSARRIAYDSNDGSNYKAFVGRIPGVTTSNGGYVHYLAGHQYEGNSEGVLNGQRMYLNAFLRSATRPSNCNLSISSPVTNAGGATYCNNVDPDTIGSASPSGISIDSIQYQWQYRNGTSGDWINIVGATGAAFDPPNLTQTRQYRRLAINSNCGDWLSSNAITFTINLPVTNAGIINGGGTFCNSGDPETINGTNASGNSSGNIQYQWQYRNGTSGNWANIANATGASYDPPNLTQTRQYQRLAKNDNCGDWLSSNIVIFSIEPQLNAGTDSTLTICEGVILSESRLFNALGRTPERGGIWSPALAGAGTYTYTHATTICPSDSAQIVVSDSTCTISLGDLVWLDLNGDSLQGDLEVGLENIPVCIVNQSVVVRNGISFPIGTFLDTVLTDVNGLYAFDNLPDGDWEIKIHSDPNIYIPTFDADGGILNVCNFTLTGGLVQPNDNSWCNNPDCLRELDFGLRFAGNHNLSGNICIDDDSKDGICNDNRDMQLDSFPVHLYDGAGRYFGGVYTKTGGNYLFPFLLADNYRSTVFTNQRNLATYSFTTKVEDTPALKISHVGSRILQLVAVYGKVIGVDFAFLLLEICDDGIDNDGDGLIDCEDSSCGPTIGIISTNIPSNCPYLDNGRITINATGDNLVYSINGGKNYQNSNIFNNLSGGIYTVVIKNAISGCAKDTREIILLDKDCTKNCVIALNDSFTSTCSSQSIHSHVGRNDLHLNNAKFTLVEVPNHSTTNLASDGSFEYIPSLNTCGTDQFTYSVCDSVTNCCDTAVATLIISDNTAPVLLNIPNDLTINCDEEIPVPALVSVYDNCPFISIEATESSTQEEGGCRLYDYTLTREWTAKDFCGNTNTAQQTIEIQDITPPSIYRIYTLPNGKKLVAGTMQNVTHRWKTIQLPIEFRNAPIIFTQIVTNQETSPAVTRIRNCTTNQFELKLQEEEANNNFRTGESVAWIAVEQGIQSTPFPLEAKKISLTDAWKQVNFEESYTNLPSFFATIQTTIDSDPAIIRFNNPSSSNIDIQMEEETSLDTNTIHNTEQVAFLSIAQNIDITNDKTEIFGETGSVSINDEWKTVTFKNEYYNPIVVTSIPQNKGNDGGVVRIRNVKTNTNSFDIQFQEWDYLDGIHNQEEVAYMVIEGTVPLNTQPFCSLGTDSLLAGVDWIAVDNCDINVPLNYEEKDSTDGAASITIRTWSAEDECGNKTSYQQNVTCQGVAVRVRTVLQGAMIGNQGNGLMRDDLRKKDYLPLAEPYTDLPQFEHRGEGGIEVASTSLFEIEGPQAVVDWILLELRPKDSPGEVIATCSGLVQRDGDVITAQGDTIISFYNVPTGAYYVSVKHRNHLGMMTLFSHDLNPYTTPLIDFTYEFTPIIGKNSSVEIDGKKSQWSGDLNGDNKVIFQGPGNDQFPVFVKVLLDDYNNTGLLNYISSGYAESDFNLDGTVIYQGPGNDRANFLWNTVLKHPENNTKLSNFVIQLELPNEENNIIPINEEFNIDSDGDGIKDFIEDKNRNGQVDSDETDPKNPDTDDDGIADGVEDVNQNGQVDTGETNPVLADTDDDGIADGVEDANQNGQVDTGETSPLLADTDDDGITDGVEDANQNGQVDEGESDPLNPLDPYDNAPAPNVLITEGKDTYIKQKPGPDYENYGQKKTIHHKAKENEEERGLIQFDFSASPVNKIHAAKLFLYLENGQGGENHIKAHQITTAWEEGTQSGKQGEANWHKATPNKSWNTKGGDYNANVLGRMPTDKVGYQAMELPAALVQNWIDHPSNNHGLLLVSNGRDADKHIEFGSFDGDLDKRPYLEINGQRVGNVEELDSDGDGIIDIEEKANGSNPSDACDPNPYHENCTPLDNDEDGYFGNYPPNHPQFDLNDNDNCLPIVTDDCFDYETIKTGNWDAPSTWKNGSMPPLILNRKKVLITHNIIIKEKTISNGSTNGNLELKNGAILTIQGATLKLEKGNLKIEDLAIISTNNSTIQLVEGDFEVTNKAQLNLTLSTIILQKGKFKMDNSEVKLKEVKLEIEEDFEQKGNQIRTIIDDSKITIGGKFKIEGGVHNLTNVCMNVSKELEFIGGIYSWTNVCLKAGINESSKFKVEKAAQFTFEQSSLKINNGNFELNDGIVKGNLTALWIEDGHLINNSNWNVIINQYCISGNINVPTDHLSAENCTRITKFFDSCNCN